MDTQEQIQSFLSTPEGQQFKAKTILEMTNMYLVKIVEQLAHPDLKLREKMLLNLALMECLKTIEENEKTLNSTTLSQNSEIS
jgi:hypothetical protein